MEHLVRFLAIALTLSWSLSCGPAWGLAGGRSAGKKPYAAGEILVKFKMDVSQSRIEEINGRMGAEILKKMGTLYLLRIPETADVEEMVDKYSGLPEVEYAEPNYIHTIQE